MNRLFYRLALFSLFALFLLSNLSAQAKVTEIRLAKQYGLSYLPLIVIEQKNLIEKHAKIAGLGDVQTTWITLGGGATTNDALLSGSVDFAASGVAPLITLWAKSNGNVKGVAALDTTPIFLNTNNPTIKSIKDFTDKDRIALPSVKVSIQAVVLQMAAAKTFGKKHFDKLDPLTVSMKHPDAMIALLSENSEITAHFASPPFMFLELENPKVRTVLSSYDVLGGPHTFNVLSTTKAFYEKNPKAYSVVLKALEEAIAIVKNDKKAAAELYIKSTNSKESVAEILSQLNNPLMDYSTTPHQITKFSDFLYRIGSIDKKPNSWKELFFSNIHSQKGS